MIDKSIMRLEIINFFKEVKVNKNSYNKNWYINKSAEHIYDFIHNYYPEGHTLSNVPLSQKLYHIIHDLDHLPSNKFISLRYGYAKGRVTFSGKSIEKFLERLSSKDVYEDMFMTEEETTQKVVGYITTSAYSTLLKDQLLVNSIFFYTKHIDEKKYKISYFYNNKNITCKCGEKLQFKNKNTFSLSSTCGDKLCIREVISTAASSRDLSYLQEENVRRKRVESRKHYTHSKETKEKIRESNIKTWKERGPTQTLINRLNGVHIKQSITMRRKIENGEFTPKTSNRYNKTRLVSDITGVSTYRSKWEMKFHESNTHLEYEKTRMPYTHDGKHHVYIIDFTDINNKILYEIKPKSLLNDSKNQSKFSAARQWCSDNGYTFQIITEDDIYGPRLM